MSLVVENGSGLSNAESYASVSDSTAYHSALGNTSWAVLSSTLQEQALRRATIYLVGKYRLRWAGSRMTTAQALDWPRSLVPVADTPYKSYYPNNVVPREVVDACCSLAVRAAEGELLSDQDQRVSSVTVGPISQTFEAGSTVATQYPEIDALLRPLLKSGNGQIRMVRA
jgi:hypothetical protein